MKDHYNWYPWHLAPHWARFAATDADGKRYWYESEPDISYSDDDKPATHWYGGGRNRPIDDDGPKYWDESLMERP